MDRTTWVHPGKRVQPAAFSLEFHDLAVLDFRFRVVQLNQLKWADYLKRKNPVAAALMARMKIRKRDRPLVKLECLRLLATLRLDRRRSRLIAHFVSSYLRLNEQEMRIYRRDLETIPQAERREIMQFTNEWVEEGIVKGRLEGRLEGQVEGRLQALRESLPILLQRLFGERAADLIQRLPEFGIDSLSRLQAQLKAGAELEELQF